MADEMKSSLSTSLAAKVTCSHLYEVNIVWLDLYMKLLVRLHIRNQQQQLYDEFELVDAEVLWSNLNNMGIDHDRMCIFV